MTAQPSRKTNSCLLIVGVLIGGFILCALFSAVSHFISPGTVPQATSASLFTEPVLNTSVATPTPRVIDTSTPVLDAKSSLKAAITMALGDGDRKVPRIKGISFDAFEQGDVFVEWAINDNLSEDLIRFGARDDVTKILKAVAESGYKFTSVTVQGYFPMQDVYGNSSETMVVNLVYLKTTINKINWANFLLDNVYKIADTSENGTPIVHYVQPLFAAP